MTLLLLLGACALTCLACKLIAWGLGGFRREPAPGPQIILGDILAAEPISLTAPVQAEALIRYRSAEQEDTERKITVRALTLAPAGDGVFRLCKVEAYCHLRHAPRSFLPERISRLADPRTGEIASDVAGWIMHACGRRETVLPVKPRPARRAPRPVI